MTPLEYHDIIKHRNSKYGIKKAALYLAQQKLCWICKQKMKLQTATVDHIIPVSKGGTDHISNLRLAHASCNQRRGNDWPTTADWIEMINE